MVVERRKQNSGTSKIEILSPNDKAIDLRKPLSLIQTHDIHINHQIHQT